MTLRELIADYMRSDMKLDDEIVVRRVFRDKEGCLTKALITKVERLGIGRIIVEEDNGWIEEERSHGN